MYNRLLKLDQSVVPYAPNSQKKVTHSTIKVLHQPTSSECVTTFPCSLPRAWPNNNEGKLLKFAMDLIVCPGVSFFWQSDWLRLQFLAVVLAM